jgi:hypothetical protein
MKGMESIVILKFYVQDPSLIFRLEINVLRS